MSLFLRTAQASCKTQQLQCHIRAAALGDIWTVRKGQGQNEYLRSTNDSRVT